LYLAIDALVASGDRLRLIRSETLVGEALGDFVVLESLTLHVKDKLVLRIELMRYSFAGRIASTRYARNILRDGHVFSEVFAWLRVLPVLDR